MFTLAFVSVSLSVLQTGLAPSPHYRRERNKRGSKQDSMLTPKQNKCKHEYK